MENIKTLSQFPPVLCWQVWVLLRKNSTHIWKWQSTPVFLPRKSYGQRSLAGCSPWSHKRVRHDWVTKWQPIRNMPFWIYQLWLCNLFSTLAMFQQNVTSLWVDNCLNIRLMNDFLWLVIVHIPIQTLKLKQQSNQIIIDFFMDYQYGWLLCNCDGYHLQPNFSKISFMWAEIYKKND